MSLNPISNLRAALIVFTLALTALFISDVAAQPTYDEVEQTIYTHWERVYPGEGDAAVRVARCEGWNATANWDIRHISPTSDAGPFQINQIHGQRGGVIEGRWPEYVQELVPNIETALHLRALSGWSPWANSAHCHGQIHAGLAAPLNLGPVVVPPLPPAVVVGFDGVVVPVFTG